MFQAQRDTLLEAQGENDADPKATLARRAALEPVTPAQVPRKYIPRRLETCDGKALCRLWSSVLGCANRMLCQAVTCLLFLTTSSSLLTRFVTWQKVAAVALMCVPNHSFLSGVSPLP